MLIHIPPEPPTPTIEKIVNICPGLPYCELVGDEAIENQRAGCHWCRKETYWTDGDITVDMPVWDMPDDADSPDIEVEHVVQTVSGGFAVETDEIYVAQPEPIGLVPIVTENPGSRWTLMKWTVAHRLLELAVKVMPGGRAKGTLIMNLMEYNRQNRR